MERSRFRNESSLAGDEGRPGPQPGAAVDSEVVGLAVADQTAAVGPGVAAAAPAGDHSVAVFRAVVVHLAAAEAAAASRAPS